MDFGGLIGLVIMIEGLPQVRGCKTGYPRLDEIILSPYSLYKSTYTHIYVYIECKPKPYSVHVGPHIESGSLGTYRGCRARPTEPRTGSLVDSGFLSSSVTRQPV